MASFIKPLRDFPSCSAADLIISFFPFGTTNAIRSYVFSLYLRLLAVEVFPNIISSFLLVCKILIYYNYYTTIHILMQVYNLHKHTCVSLFVLSIEILAQVCYNIITVKDRRKPKREVNRSGKLKSEAEKLVA